jgi:hypothetical protein
MFEHLLLFGRLIANSTIVTSTGAGDYCQYTVFATVEKLYYLSDIATAVCHYQLFSGIPYRILP